MANSWAQAGGWCGAATAVIYLVLVFLQLPMSIGRVFFFGVSLLIVVAMLGLYHVLRAHRRSVILDVGAVFTVAGAVIMNLTAVVQNSLLHYANAATPHDVDPTLRRTVLALLTGAVCVSGAGAQETAGRQAGAVFLLEAVRGRLEVQDASLASFQATVRERISVAVRSPVREHLVYRREMAAHLDWSRTARPRIRMLAAREYRAVPGTGVLVLDGVEREAFDLVFEPGSQLRSIGFGSFRLGDHPLAPASDGRYRFALGDTMDLQLPGGRTLHLIEVRIDPIQAVFPAVSGSMWIDDASHTVVREVYSPIVDPDVGSTGVPFIGDVSMKVERIVIEHGLWELRWWLPRVLTFEGTVAVGRLAGATFRYERAYSDYTVLGVIADAAPAVPPDPTTRRWVVEVPSDRSSLLHSDELPTSIFSPETPAAAALTALRDAPWPARPPRTLQPRVTYAHIAPLDLMRYNRVEGVSVGARAGVRRWWGTAEVTARAATARWNPELTTRILHERDQATLSVAVFHRIDAMELHGAAPGGTGSLNALLFGHDDADYYRATGAAIEFARGGAARLRVRLGAQREAPLDAAADWTLPRLLGRQRPLRPNTRALTATLVRPAIMLEASGGSNEVGRWQVRLAGDAAGGTFDFARAALFLRAGTREHARLTAAADVAAGMSWGEVPPQHEWLLGGAASLRGYPGATLTGSRFAIARLDVSAGSPATRIHVFTDVGTTRNSITPERTGRREDVGVGLGLLDGALRIDVAHALHSPRGWRVSLSGPAGL